MKKEKTDWGFVTVLLCIGAILITMCYIGKYIDMQAQRIDYLEVDNIRHSEALSILLPSIKKEEAKGGTHWHDKEH